MKAPRWTSWTSTNPGRRFYSCRYHEVTENWKSDMIIDGICCFDRSLFDYLQNNGGCNYFEWHDLPMSKRAKEVLNELKEERDMLLVEKMNLWMLNNAGSGNYEEDVAKIWLELRKLKKAPLQEHGELHIAKRNMKIAYVVAMISWMVLVCVLLL